MAETPEARAASAPLRMGTWFWGCGITPGRWTPDIVNNEFVLKPESAPLEKVKQHLNFLTGFDAILDGKPNHVHVSGTFSLRSGIAPTKFGVMEGPTFETAIADRIGAGVRFKTVDFSATGNVRDTYSYRSAQVRNTPEVSPEALYDRLFGVEFNASAGGEFVPDAKALRRLSVLSVVGEQRKSMAQQLGKEDQDRLDQYFTSVREVEQQLELQTVEPARVEACQAPARPEPMEANYDLANVHRNHELMARLLAMALVCDQTRSFNVLFSNSASSLHRSGEASSHHLYTHEEFTDSELGYQVETSKFVVENMKGWAKFVEILANTPEGDGSLLDNCLVFAHSDTSWAKIHAVQGIPMMTAGAAGGRLRTRQLVTANGDPITRVGLTLQQLVGLPISEWGAGAMRTDAPVSKLLA
ncbi:hypothetical protein HAD_00880 [Hyphomonas adhaerens MHS-3]|uniref:DUF1552 domain-containing protein n=1 Tax=Hyphomonas adhaerens MHS-3 TaxID=1280949 RepID=A0A069E352_9PROT|nr:DUF1552 domain-containing protein [Hyphomonas adhaerens]KCZ84189.1 hypothetical protein HAD_00880 [Hyphomonas adhaerens MHS-3]